MTIVARFDAGIRRACPRRRSCGKCWWTGCASAASRWARGGASGPRGGGRGAAPRAGPALRLLLLQLPLREGGWRAGEQHPHSTAHCRRRGGRGGPLPRASLSTQQHGSGGPSGRRAPLVSPPRISNLRPSKPCRRMECTRVGPGHAVGRPRWSASASARPLKRVGRGSSRYTCSIRPGPHAWWAAGCAWHLCNSCATNTALPPRGRWRRRSRKTETALGRCWRLYNPLPLCYDSVVKKRERARLTCDGSGGTPRCR